MAHCLAVGRVLVCQLCAESDRPLANPARVGDGVRIDRPRAPILGAGSIYHVGTRGIRRMPIVHDDFDRHAFLRILGDAASRQRWECLAYCLMSNHYHLLVRTPEPDLPVGMQRLNYLHAYRFNRRHGYSGHLFERRYFSELIEDDAQLITCAQYIELNPVRAGITSSPEEWPWSSCASILGLRHNPSWFEPLPLLSLLDHNLNRARIGYALRLGETARLRRVPLPGSGTRPA